MCRGSRGFVKEWFSEGLGILKDISFDEDLENTIREDVVDQFDHFGLGVEVK